MWKIVSYIYRFSKIVFRTLKCIICSRPVRWIIIVGTVGVSLCMLCNYLEKLLILEIIRMQTEHMQPISISIPVKDLSNRPTNKMSLVGWFWNWRKKPYNITLDLDTLLSTNDAQQRKRATQIMRFGYPGTDNIRPYNNYVLSYDRKNKIPHWVYEHLTSDFKYGDNSLDYGRCFPLHSDERIHPHFRSDITDFIDSGYVTRQLASVPNHLSSAATLEEVFYLSSMVPHRGVSPKGDCWGVLERRIRELTEDHSNVYACTGPLFLPHTEANGKTYVKYEVIGKNDVAVPTHIFKYVIGESKNKDLNLWCYLFENKVIEDVKTPLENFYVDPVALEKTSGLIFLRGISLARFKTINGKPNPFLSK